MQNVTLDEQENLINCVRQIIGRMDNEIQQAQNNIQNSQKKQKEQHDRKLKGSVNFKVGELVLMYKSNLQDKKKLEERWKRPYYIHTDLGNGVYKLRTLDRKILKIPINGDRLKQYH